MANNTTKKVWEAVKTPRYEQREERYERLPPPATPTHPLHLEHALYDYSIGDTQGMTKQYVIAPTR